MNSSRLRILAVGKVRRRWIQEGIDLYRKRLPGLQIQELRDSTRESVMILFIIAAAGVFSYMLSSLFITQSIAEWIGTLEVNRWVLMLCINIFLLIAGFFLPPVAVILMAAPILLPVIISRRSAKN